MGGGGAGGLSPPLLLALLLLLLLRLRRALPYVRPFPGPPQKRPEDIGRIQFIDGAT